MNPVILRDVTRHTSPGFQRKSLCRTQTSPLVERRQHVQKHPRPVTSPVQMANLERMAFGFDKEETPAQILMSKSASNFPCSEKPPILQRFNSVSPSTSRKKIMDKLSPRSLRKSAMLRSSSLKSDPGDRSVDTCNGCGFPVLDDRVSITGKRGKRRLFHAECFKCSM